MIRHLLSKEVAEHWKLLLLVAVLELACLLLLLGRGIAENDSISLLTSLRDYLVLVGPVAASIAMQAFFAKELRNKTILFLETLPVPRSDSVVAKLLLAAVFIFGGALAALAIALLAAHRHEPIEWEFVTILAAKTIVLTAGTFALTFLAGILGRYRWPFYCSLFVLAFIHEQAGGELDRVPPMSLLGAEFATERYSLPTSDLIWVTAAAVGIVSFGLLLLLLRNGSAAILLGERMSHREKVLVAGVLLSSLLAADVLTDERPEPPYEVRNPAALRTSTPELTLTVVPPSSSDSRVEELAEMLHSGLEPLSDLLGTGELPPVFIIHRDDLDDHRFELARARQRDGIVVRANLGGERLALRDLLAFTTGALIDEVSDERSRTESRSWLRDGLAELWAEQQLAPHLGSNVGELWLRALHANRRGFDPADTDRWYLVQEALGEPVAAAFAWSGLVVLSEALGPEGTRDLLRSVIRPLPAAGIRKSNREEWLRFESLLRPRLDRAAFFDRWRARLATEASKVGLRLDRIPLMSASVTMNEAGRARKVTFSATSDRPPDDGRVISLLWSRLPAIDDPISPLDLAREERPFRREASILVPAALPPGARIFLAGSAYSTELGCEFRFGATRKTVP